MSHTGVRRAQDDAYIRRKGTRGILCGSHTDVSSIPHDSVVVKADKWIQIMDLFDVQDLPQFSSHGQMQPVTSSHLAFTSTLLLVLNSSSLLHTVVPFDADSPCVLLTALLCLTKSDYPCCRLGRFIAFLISITGRVLTICQHISTCSVGFVSNSPHSSYILPVSKAPPFSYSVYKSSEASCNTDQVHTAVKTGLLFCLEELRLSSQVPGNQRGAVRVFDSTNRGTRSSL